MARTGRGAAPAARADATVRSGDAPTDRTESKTPRTARGIATRAALVAAARKVFEEHGYLGARVIDVTATANTALGTFYQYFEDKEDIWIAVFEELSQQGLHPPTLDYLAENDVDPVETIREHHRIYLEAVWKNIRLLRVQDEVLSVSDRFRRIRKAEAQPYIEATCATIVSLQQDGRADPSINPRRMARSLSIAASRTAFVSFVIEDEGDEAIDELADTLTALWVNALKMPVGRTPNQV
ncbi:MAG TPA: TetR/AcrR family transcriptional regulator [Microbacterium sp.]|uniref:TetR/AcrR family transcriptional regulator n=1 Tax=Microbacterium sp. TaxID=51671 RepID=UPI002B4A179E|nr:TetR/AcrR family transcriptional regulator [Microbacterium sp.]HKT58178.1 TetR/AcrR family transcriptional regulator [Microbacterium sp.]